MSFSPERYNSIKDERPLGLKILVFFSAGMTILGFLAFLIFGIITFAQSNFGIFIGLFILIFILSAINLILLYYLYNLNRTAYAIFTAFTGLNLFLSLISLNIIGILLQGSMLAYLLSIEDFF